MSYFKNLFSTGAIIKTPPFIIQKIIKETVNRNYKTIIELGAGRGEITNEVYKVIDTSNTTYYAFEINSEYSDILKLNHEKIIVKCEDAFNFKNHITIQPDLIICSIPLSFFSKKKINKLLEEMIQSLNENGKILILFHAFWLKNLITKTLQKSKITNFYSIPPYFLCTYIK